MRASGFGSKDAAVASKEDSEMSPGQEEALRALGKGSRGLSEQRCSRHIQAGGDLLETFRA